MIQTFEELEERRKEAYANIESFEESGDKADVAYYHGVVDTLNVIPNNLYDNVDFLSEMLIMQNNLQKVVGTKCDVPFLKDMILSLTGELHEMLRETPFKNWSKRHMAIRNSGNNFIDKEKFDEELVDCWHFFMNIVNFSGMTAKDLYDGYMNKNKVNHDRQNNGY